MKKNKSIVLGITGGIAAYKAAELVRLLTNADIDVQVVMTEGATKFITPLTMQALSGKPVYVGMWDSNIDNGMPHIELSREADAILIAPATAEFVAKLLHGRADDLLSTLCLARECPLLVAPAMNKQMWENPATQRNFNQLKEDKINILGPDNGEQACGETGDGRMLEAEELLSHVLAHFTPKAFLNKHIMVTAGATIEMIDPVRGITNLSSGKMGYAIAQAAANMGAKVTLISGQSNLTHPTNVKVISVTNAEHMYQSVMQDIQSQDIFISVAAVSDYTPTAVSEHKIKKSADQLTLSLVRNKDILSEVAHLPNPPFCVGFAAESENVLEYATQKRTAKKLPLIVANEVTSAMGGDDNQVTLIDDNGRHTLQLASKTIIANQILEHIARLL
jgi:phosphopantothenoylcysteine decarboxylase/phosphopantothenate--cysteine ligase